MNPLPPAPEAADGRRLRSRQSRQKIIDAMIELVNEGVLEPTAEQVSARAGVAMRTVFRHFRDMETLYREIWRRLHAQFERLVATDIRAGSWRETLHQLADRRVRVYEEFMPMRLASDALRHRSPFLQEERAAFVARSRQILRDHLPADVAAAWLTFESLDAALGYEHWMRLRREQQLSVDDARRVLHHTLDCVLPPAD